MKKLLLILMMIVLVAFALMILVFPVESMYTALDSEHEIPETILISKLGIEVSYQYWYDTKEGIMKVEFVTYIDEDDQTSCAQIVDAEVGDTFTGISGRTYVLQEQTTLTQAQIQYLTHKDIVVVGEWVPVDEASDSGGSEGTSSIGISTLGPYYFIEGGVTYKYYIGYIPPPPPITEVDEAVDGGWIVTYFQQN